MLKLIFEGNTISEVHAQLSLYASTIGIAAATAAAPNAPTAPAAPVSEGTAPSSAGVETPVPASPASAGTIPAAPTSASPSSGVELDAAGVAWDPAKHAGTKAKVASGLWRMKVGVKRAPGEGEDSPNYRKPGEEASAGAAPTVPAAPVPAAPVPAAPVPEAPPAPVVDPMEAARADGWIAHPQAPGFHYKGQDVKADADVAALYAGAPAVDDEFAAFAAASTAPAVGRTWTDADLSQFCNQAAQKVGSGDPVKAIIEKYVPAGEVAHSRNIPTEKREAFAQECESTFGFQYAAA